MPSATSPELRNPWRAFLVDVDRYLPLSIEIHCLGGFVAALYYDLPRPTNDPDYIEVVPHDAMATVQEVAGVESALARKHRVHVQHVGVASLPESYADRLTELFPARFRRLRLFALDPHDLAERVLRFRRPDGRLLPEVPPSAAVPADPVGALRARHDVQGLRLHARTACAGWLGERLDVGWAIDVLHPLAARPAGPPPICG